MYALNFDLKSLITDIAIIASSVIVASSIVVACTIVAAFAAVLSWPTTASSVAIFAIVSSSTVSVPFIAKPSSTTMPLPYLLVIQPKHVNFKPELMDVLLLFHGLQPFASTTVQSYCATFFIGKQHFTFTTSSSYFVVATSSYCTDTV